MHIPRCNQHCSSFINLAVSSIINYLADDITLSALKNTNVLSIKSSLAVSYLPSHYKKIHFCTLHLLINFGHNYLHAYMYIILSRAKWFIDTSMALTMTIENISPYSQLHAPLSIIRQVNIYETLKY